MVKLSVGEQSKELHKQLEIIQRMLREQRLKWSTSFRPGEKEIAVKNINKLIEQEKLVWKQLNPIKTELLDKQRESFRYKSWRNFVDFTKGKTGFEILTSLNDLK